MQIKVFRPTDHKVKALIYWASGSGKTVFGGTSPKPIFASAESGLLSLGSKEVPFVEIKSIKDLEELLAYLKKGDHQFETVVIDSITEINDIIKLEIEKKTGKQMQLQDWGTLAKKIKDILRNFRDLPMHVLMISQESIEKDGDVVTKVLPYLNGKSATEIASFMDIVGYLFVEKTGDRKIITSSDPRLITKDRSQKIGNETEPDFWVWVEKVKAIKIGEQKVMHNSDDAVAPSGEAEQKNDPVDETPASDDQQAPEVETPPKQAKLPANKVKQVQIKWREFAEKNGWNTADSDTKRKATMMKYYQVDSANDLLPDQAEDFITKIQVAIDKVVAQ